MSQFRHTLSQKGPNAQVPSAQPGAGPGEPSGPLPGQPRMPETAGYSDPFDSFKQQRR